MKEFKIILPDGEKEVIEYDEDTDKIEKVNKILNEWRSYINNCWVFFGKADKFHINHEDKVKMMLNALAAFLDNSSIEDRKNSKEISLEYLNNGKKQTKYESNNIVLGLQKDQDTYDYYNKMKIKKYNKSNTYKFKHIFSQDNIKKQEVYKLKNKDVYKSPSDLEYFKNTYEFTEEQFKKWLEKPFRNAYKQNVFTIKTKTYKGWQGDIDSKKPFVSKWCYVNSDGEFTFTKTIKKQIVKTKYQIDIDNVPQYKDIRKDKYYKDEKGWSMDNIFCVEQEGKMYFWDMNINKIDNKYIIKFPVKD